MNKLRKDRLSRGYFCDHITSPPCSANTSRCIIFTGFSEEPPPPNIDRLLIYPCSIKLSSVRPRGCIYHPLESDDILLQKDLHEIKSLCSITCGHTEGFRHFFSLPHIQSFTSSLCMWLIFRVKTGVKTHLCRLQLSQKWILSACQLCNQGWGLLDVHMASDIPEAYTKGSHATNTL